MNILKEYFIAPLFFSIKNIFHCLQGTQVYPGVRIRNTKIEEKVKIYNATLLYDSVVGKHTYIQRNCTILNSSIGRFCSIAEGVKMGLGKHPVSEFISTHPFCFGKNTSHWLSDKCPPPSTHKFNENEPVIVGHDVCIGANTVILDGVNVGNGVIIGAGSVVTKNIPSYAVAAGVPCKVLYYRFEENERKELEKARWWDQNYDTLEKILPTFKRFNSRNIHEKNNNTSE